MVRTIIISSCVSVQGEFVRELSNGHIVIAVGDKTFTGQPIAA